MLLVLGIGCEKPPVITAYETPNNRDVSPTGSVKVDFIVRSFFIDFDCLERTKLAFAYTYINFLNDDFFFEFNVYSDKQLYSLELPPGEYYYCAQVVCLCEDLECSIDNYVGENNTKSTYGSFIVKADKVIEVVPDFNN